MTGDLDWESLWRKPEHPPAPTNAVPVDASRAGRYVQVAIDRECEAVVTAANGTRNDTLNTAAFNLGQFVGGGYIDESTVDKALTWAGRAAGLDDKEIDATITSGLRAGKLQPRVITERTEATWPTMTSPGTAYTVSAPNAGMTSGVDAAATGTTQPDEAQNPDPDELLAFHRARLLSAETERQRASRAARRLLDAEEALASFRPPPYTPTLTEELAIPDEPVTYTIDQMLPTGGNVLLASAFKAGKTTLVNNLAKALADRRPFLNKFDVADTPGRVALFNYEVDQRQYRRWLREVGITDTDRVVVLNLRGYRLPLAAPHVEDWVASWLSERAVTTWVVDPFARAFTGSGRSENDNTEVGTFLDTLDVIKHRAGVNDLVLPTHTGRTEMEIGDERARGATRLDDWADVRWILTQDDDDVRYLRASGRDVDVAEEKLTFDETTRALTFGGGDRRWEAKQRLDDLVIGIVRSSPGISVRGIREAVRATGLRGRLTNTDDAVVRVVGAHRVRVEKDGQTSRHYSTELQAFGGTV